MENPSKIKTIILFLALAAFIVILSIASGRLWGGKSESLQELTDLAIR